MTSEISLKKALELVTFYKDPDGIWCVDDVHGDVHGNVHGDVCGTVQGFCNTVKGNCNTVKGNCNTVKGNCGTVEGNCNTVKGAVHYTINGRKWQYIETPKEKFMRLLNETNNMELINAFVQLEDN